MTRMTAVRLTLTNVMKGVHSRHDICFSSKKAVNKNHVRKSPADNLASLDYYTLFSNLVPIQLQRFQPHTHTHTQKQKHLENIP